ncbi:hypothetical protein D3C85_651630 [compost metagenome]
MNRPVHGAVSGNRTLRENYNRRVDVINEGYDVALNLCFPPLEDSELVMKILVNSPQALVASAAFVQRFPALKLPADLSDLLSLRTTPWRLVVKAGGMKQQESCDENLLSLSPTTR